MQRRANRVLVAMTCVAALLSITAAQSSAQDGVPQIMAPRVTLAPVPAKPADKPPPSSAETAGRFNGAMDARANMLEGLGQSRARAAEEAVDFFDHQPGGAISAIKAETEAVSEAGRAAEAAKLGRVTSSVGNLLTVGSVVKNVYDGNYEGVVDTGVDEAVSRGGCALMGANPALCGAWSAGLTFGSIVRDIEINENHTTIGDRVTDFWAKTLLPSDEEIMAKAQTDFDARKAQMRADADQRYQSTAGQLISQQAAYDQEQAARAAAEAEQRAQAQQASNSDGGSGFADALGAIAGVALQVAANNMTPVPAAPAPVAAPTPAPARAATPVVVAPPPAPARAVTATPVTAVRPDTGVGAKCNKTFNTPTGCHPGHDEKAHPGGCHCG